MGPVGVQLPGELLEYNLTLAARPLLASVPKLHALCQSAEEGEYALRDLWAQGRQPYA